ncbi:senescence marker protein-30, putative [Ixodes scapularis]|uniref:Senescence marker protein-30, putative n=2 Tax=Ixodes scapularis TaxID=6945 RepID=B7QF78_IXOSC|nr:senescence marker protein-30, putative [Ixodes scapularis]|eukprot:XP_002414192.1 senescence marker protein-30, putative [Ixodes scapularis]
MKVEQAGAHMSALGEGPHWDCRSSTLLYVDATTGEIMRFDPLAKGETDVIHLDGEIGNLIPYTEDNRKLMVCMNNGVYKLDLDTGAQTLLAEMFGPDPPVRSRINDGKCDAMGRLWAGTLTWDVDLKNYVPEENNFYCFSKGKLTLKVPHISLSNGIAWTTDNRTMFYNDSIPGKTYVFNFDLDTGDIGNRHVFIDFKITPGYENLGLPDGMTTDELPRMKVERAGERRNVLGEGPHWDHRSSTLLYDDAQNGEIVRFDPQAGKETEIISLDGEIGNLIPYVEDNRKLMVCMESAIYKLDLDTRDQTLLEEMLDPDCPVRTRINDGKCDAKGRLWAGTMPREVDIENSVRGKNNFYCFSKGKVTLKMPQISLSNGITWTSDNRTMFYNDSIPGKTYVFNFDVDTGDISNRRVFIDFTTTPGYENLGLPDGMTIDVNDKIWMACFGVGSVIQIDPETAKILNTVKVPAKYTTSCCFGGQNYDVLYVTSASFMKDATQPGDGLLYQVTELGVKGKAAFEFAG